ncbi:MAG TPA: S41 family peptidase [Spirochaetia bacterium]|nr:S41 family peptidase [Spirochaetia bacterium]
MRPFGSRERLAWTVVTAVLVAGLAFFALSPRVLAGSTEDETQAYLSAIGQVFREIRDTYVDADKAVPKALYEGALKGMFDALGDPYSMYLNAAEWTDLTDISTGSFGGVGLEITKVDKVGAQVVSALEGTPGYRAGVTAGDMIVKVDGNNVADLTLSAIRDALRGTPHTDVTVTIKRGDTVQFDTTITRDIIQLRTVKYAMMPGGIGYLRLSEFTPQSAEQCREAIRAFVAANYTSMILDLRGNPGGLLNSAVDVANLFLNQGVIVQRKSERVPSENVTYNARPGRMIVDPKIPVVVLVDRYSASAAEILSGALKDYHRATLMGEKTYGKGSVQTVQALGDGGYRLTTSRYYTPAGVTTGVSIDHKGIEPDRAVSEPALTDDQQKALNDLLNGTFIKDFVKATPNPTDADLTRFIAGLHAKGIALDDRYLRRLVRVQQNITNNNPPPYDVDFDIVLQAAVKALSNHEIGTESAGRI